MGLDLSGFLNVLAEELVTKTDISANITPNRRKERSTREQRAGKKKQLLRKLKPLNTPYKK